MRTTRQTPRSEVRRRPHLEIYEVLDAKPVIDLRAPNTRPEYRPVTALTPGSSKSVSRRCARRVGPRRCYTTSRDELVRLDEATQYVQRPEMQEALAAGEGDPGARQCAYMHALPESPFSTVQQRLNCLEEMDVLEKQHRHGTAARYWLNGHATSEAEER